MVILPSSSNALPGIYSEAGSSLFFQRNCLLMPLKRLNMWTDGRIFHEAIPREQRGIHTAKILCFAH
jgi:hypothetical protein